MSSANTIANTSVVPAFTTINPYGDDFNEDKNYHRIIFKPGYPVQTRELTQIQTIQQNQIERFGRNIFKNGSIVDGGQISYITAQSINLQSQYANTEVDVSQFFGKIITGFNSNNVIAQVISGLPSDGTNPPVLMINYISGTQFSNNSTTIQIQGSNTYANIASSNVFGRGMTATISDGIFFMNGFFVKNPTQTIVISPYSIAPNVKIGLEFTEGKITSGQDSSLLDPAQESSSYQAPGADRLQIILSLSQRSYDSIDDSNFIELLRLKTGIAELLNLLPLYSDIEDEMARRLYDQSGNYTVNAFNLELDNSSNSSNLIVRLDPGKAYIYGYEFQTIAATDLEVNRARTTANVTDLDILTAYGNFVKVGQVQGAFDISTMVTADLHCIPYQYVDNTSANTYNSTKIGTVRVRDLEYDSSTNTSNGASFIHKLYFFDPRLAPISGNVTSATSNTITINNANITSNSNAYVNTYIQIVAGLSSGDQKLITSWNGSTKTATVDSNFTTTPGANSQFNLNFSFKDTEAIVVATAGSSFTANSNISLQSKDNGTANGKTVISEPGFQTLIFSLPNQYIAANTGPQQYQYRKTFTSRTFTNGIGTVATGTGESHIGSGVLPDTISLENFTIIVTSPSSNTYAGQIISPASPTTITVAGATATINTGLPGDTFTATVLTDVLIKSGSKIAPKSKTLITGNTTIIATGTADGNFISSTGANSTVFLTAGQVWVNNPNKTPNKKDSLYVSDIVGITAIYDLRGATIIQGASMANYQNVTHNYSWDNGQTDTYYNHGNLILNPGVVSPLGPLVVCFDYYNHGAGSSDGYGYFSIDSYPNPSTNDGYAAIPSYTSSTGTSYSLRDSIDFRPVRQNASNTSPNFTLQGIRIPTPDTELILSYDYYIPRKDIIVLSHSGGLQWIPGIPSLIPSYSAIPSNSMLLYKLYIPPFTAHSKDVNVTYIENKRYTMRDIGTLDTRISNLEYYNSLNILEQSASNMLITDSNGLNRSKYGVLADTFTGHQIGDVTNIDYYCSMDYVNGGLFPPQDINFIDLNLISGTNYNPNAGLLTLSYTVEELISQPYASRTENVEPYALPVYVGKLELIPDGDLWVATNVNPDVVQNNLGTNDNYANPPANTVIGTANTHHTTTVIPIQEEHGFVNNRIRGYDIDGDSQQDIVREQQFANAAGGSSVKYIQLYGQAAYDIAIRDNVKFTS